MEANTQINKNGLIHTDNYIFHEIKDLKAKKELTSKDLEISENLTKIHEIREVRKNKEFSEQYNSQTYNPSFKSKEKLDEEFTIYLEGDPASKIKFNTYIQKSKINNLDKKKGLCPNCQQNKINKGLKSQYNQELIYNESIPKSQGNNLNQAICNKCLKEEQKIANEGLCNECLLQEQNIANGGLCNECLKEEQQNINGQLCNECTKEEQTISNGGLCNECIQEESKNINGRLCNECIKEEQVISKEGLCNECIQYEEKNNTNQVLCQECNEEEQLKITNQIVCDECIQNEQNKNQELCNECIQGEKNNNINESICNECKQENLNNINEGLCNECIQEEQKNNEICNDYQINQGDNNNIDEEINIGYVNAPFLKDNDVKKELNEKERNELISSLLTHFKSGKDLDNNLKYNFRNLNENDKKLIIEEIRKQIDIEKEENKFKSFANMLE